MRLLWGVEGQGEGLRAEGHMVCERSREAAFCDHANSRWVIGALLA